MLTTILSANLVYFSEKTYFLSRFPHALSASIFLLLCAEVMHEISKAKRYSNWYMALITLPPCILNISVFSSIAYVYSKTQNSKKSRKPQNV